MASSFFFLNSFYFYISPPEKLYTFCCDYSHSSILFVKLTILEHDSCFRLSKSCQPSVPNRRRNPRKAAGSRTAHLEEKLDDLVSLIRSQAAGQRGSGLTAAAAAASLEDDGEAAGPATVPSTSSASTTPASSSAHHVGGGSHRTGATSPEGPEGAGAASPTVPAYDYPVADEVAEASLAAFTGDMAPFCGVVYVPPGTPARELRRSRPFLWLSIMACTARSLREAHAIGDRVRLAIATRVVMGQERSMDVLQGMLTYLLWPHCHRKEKPFLSLWTNLCVAIVQDLGYMAAKGESAFSYVKKFWVPKQGSSEQGLGCSRTQNSERSMEERRTLLSLYVWTTM